MKTTPPHSMLVASISDRSLAILAAVGVMGTVACGIVALPSGEAQSHLALSEDHRALPRLRAVPVREATSFAATWNAIVHSLTAIATATHATRDLGPLTLAVGSAAVGEGISIELSMHGHPLGTIRVDRAACSLSPESSYSVNPTDELMLGSDQRAVSGRVRTVGDIYEWPRRAGEENRSALTMIDGFSPTWPDSAEYGDGSGRRIYSDDLPIAEVPTLAGDGYAVLAGSDA